MIPEVRACTTLSVLSGATARSDRSQNAGALGLENTWTRSSGCGPSGACRCWIRPTQDQRALRPVAPRALVASVVAVVAGRMKRTMGAMAVVEATVGAFAAAAMF